MEIGHRYYPYPGNLIILLKEATHPTAYHIKNLSTEKQGCPRVVNIIAHYPKQSLME
jgi:hypothetical protein